MRGDTESIVSTGCPAARRRQDSRAHRLRLRGGGSLQAPLSYPRRRTSDESILLEVVSLSIRGARSSPVLRSVKQQAQMRIAPNIRTRDFFSDKPLHHRVTAGCRSPVDRPFGELLYSPLIVISARATRCFPASSLDLHVSTRHHDHGRWQSGEDGVGVEAASNGTRRVARRWVGKSSPASTRKSGLRDHA